LKVKISMFYLLFYLGMGAFMPFMSLFLQERGFNGGEIGLILAAGSLTGIVSQPLFGLINDLSKDYRTILKLTTLLSALISFGFFFSQGLVPMLVTAVLFSFINTPTGPIMDSIAVEKGPTFGFAYGQVRLWGAIGFALITVVAGYVFSRVGYQYSYPTYTIFAGLILILIFTFPKLEQKHSGPVFGKALLGTVFSNGPFTLFVAMTLMISATNTMNFSYLPIYFQKLHYPMALVGWNFTIAAVVEIPLFWFSTKVMQRLGLFPMLAIGTGAYALKYCLMGFAPAVGVVLGLQALDGIAFAFYFSAAVEIVNLMAPAHAKATAQSVFGAAGGISGIIGNLAGGLIVDHQGPQFLFWLMGAIGLLATLFFYLFPGKGRYRLEKPASLKEQIQI
jgi:MFS transporter, PPP family, 3-phenylpropionic acid transporter